MHESYINVTNLDLGCKLKSRCKRNRAFYVNKFNFDKSSISIIPIDVVQLQVV